MISLIMIKNPTKGNAILQQSVAKVSFLLAANDVQNCRSYLIFICLCLDILFGQQPYGTELPIKFAMSTVNLILEILNKYGNERQKGPQIFLESILIVRFIRDKCNVQFNQKYESMSNNDTKAFFRKFRM